MARFMLKSVPDVREEFYMPGLLGHRCLGADFLNEIDELLTSAAPQVESATGPALDPLDGSSSGSTPEINTGSQPVAASMASGDADGRGAA
jgi:hypothetical protein